MKSLLILGGGTAGTMVSNRMSRLLDLDEWRITIVASSKPLLPAWFLFIPFGMYSKVM
jgi:sulfide:quinone oxidoreductase